MNYLIGFCFFMLSACSHQGGQEAAAYQVLPSQNQFTVTLPSNPTTGYQWVVKQYDESLLKLTASQYVSPQTQLIGAPGQIVFSFTIKPGVTRPKSSSIQFVYQRAWEPKSGTLKTVMIYFLS